jgi:cytochrome oxidase Cu insertion factor (SCO1/SenC/PrrC family)
VVSLLRGPLLVATSLLLPVLLGGQLPGLAGEERQRTAAELMDAVMWGAEPIGGPFSLIDHTGNHRTNADFRGRLLLVYFGFTFCPDICPIELQAMSSAVDRLGAAGEAVQPLFITVDPERDTPEHLAQYVPAFHPRLIGLTGDAAQIRKATEAYKVYYAKVADGPDFTIEHSGFIYLVDRNGRYLGFFPPGTSAEKMAEVIRPHAAAPPSVEKEAKSPNELSRRCKAVYDRCTD